jgi:hypothetical protein
LCLSTIYTASLNFFHPFKTNFWITPLSDSHEFAPFAVLGEGFTVKTPPRTAAEALIESRPTF